MEGLQEYVRFNFTVVLFASVIYSCVGCSNEAASPKIFVLEDGGNSDEHLSDSPAIKDDDSAIHEGTEYEEQSRHCVEKGDTLFAIAKKHYGDGARWFAIVKANSDTLSGPEDLNEGQILLIPKLSSPGLVAINSPIDDKPVKLPSEHTVQPGDTFYSLSVRYYGSGRYASKIIQANEGKGFDAQNLQLGDVLAIPALFE